MRRIIAQARKELTQLVRDRLALGLALVLPVALTALMGTTVSLTVTDMRIVIQDLDQTPLSRQYADAFRTPLTYHVVTLPPATSPERMLAAGRARAALIVPEHFERELRRHRPVQTQLLVDATDGNTAKIVRDAFLQGGGWPAVWWAVLAIGGIGLVFYVLAWRTMRRMQVKA